MYYKSNDKYREPTESIKMELCNNVDFDRVDRMDNYVHNSNSSDDMSRTNYDRSDSHENTRVDEDAIEDNPQTLDHFNVNIYRYKFTDHFTHELFKFAKIHQYDDRKAFKEAWNIWMEDNDDIINEEHVRLHQMGYDGDVLDKMFKSARYYFRKKSTEKKEPSKRRVYVGSQKDLLEAMDEHINSNIISGEFKPSEGFDEFCKQHVNLIKEEISVLYRAGYVNVHEIEAKIKKTYKNRYFLVVSK
jgi:hypothetical protein